MADIVLSVTYFAFLLGFGVLLANLLKKSRIPDTFFLLVLGLLLGPTLFMNPYIAKYVDMTLVNVEAMGNIPDFLRILALILIVFTSTFNLGFRLFKKFSGTSTKFAFLGVFFNTIVLGVAAHYIFNLEWVYAFLLSAVISGTGTEVLYSFRNTLSKVKKPFTIINIESILNTPMSILLPIIFLDLVKLEPGALLEPMKYVSQFWLMLAAGVGTGMLVGIFVSKIMKDMLKDYTVLLLFSIALITYALAENIGGSGMLAVAICGLITGDLPFSQKKEIRYFDDHLSELFRISVLTLLGAQVMLSVTIAEIQLIMMFFLVAVLARPLFTIALLGKERKEMTKKELFMLSFIAPRGVSAAAMAPIVAGALVAAGQAAIASSVVNIIFIIILLSVLFSTISAGIASSMVAKTLFKEKVSDEREKEMRDLEKDTEQKTVESEEKVLEEAESIV
jgi:cell volume regulation protein A